MKPGDSMTLEDTFAQKLVLPFFTSKYIVNRNFLGFNKVNKGNVRALDFLLFTMT